MLNDTTTGGLGLSEWPRKADMPKFTGSLDADARALASHVGSSRRALVTLPVKPDRNEDQQRMANRLLETVRIARHAFLAEHVGEVYDQLTDRRSRRVRLPELVNAAAERYPGLVPGREEMESELAHIQAHRDGLEIDQGIFCHAVLASAAAGRHLIESMLLPTPRARELLPQFAAAGRVELDSVLLERRGAAAHLTFLNADALNAEDNRLIADLETSVDLAMLDDQVRVGVLRGGTVNHPKYRDRRVFSAGINLKELRNGRISFIGFLLGRELGYIHKILRGLGSLPQDNRWPAETVQKPWIAAVDSFAIGGGMQLLLAVDWVIAEESSYFSLPAAEEGIVPGLSNLRLTRFTGARMARQVILGGRRIAANEPEARVICDETVPAAKMDEAIERAIHELSAPSVPANRKMLNLAEESLDLFREYLAEFALTQATCSYSKDVLAKLERRWQRSQERGR
jgi:(3,5-dihydroxyphenyl)acetyl-CoA 1,2-dioxygenase